MRITEKYDALECPACGCESIHQDNCATYWRDEEDSKIGTSTFSRAGKASFCHDMNGNPSSRRDGISISFWCECCDVISRLDIIQHKGSTYIVWDDKKG